MELSSFRDHLRLCCLHSQIIGGGPRARVQLAAMPSARPAEAFHQKPGRRGLAFNQNSLRCDGGLSGATMERRALQRLMADIDRGAG